MARNPDELKYPESWKDTVEDLKKLPPPPGVNKAEWDVKLASGDWYANVKVYANGRQVVEWYQRGVGGGPGQPDPVQTTSEGVIPAVKEEWDKEEDKQAPAPSTRVINGVLHQPSGQKDANGQDIWTPVVTTAGTARAATAPAEPPKTEDRGGTRYVWQPNPGGRDAGGQWVAVGPAPLTPAERAAQQALAPDQSTRAVTVNGQPYTVITIVPKPGQPGSPGQVVLGPNGQVVPGGLPNQGPKQEKEAVKAPDGRTLIRVTTAYPDGRVTVTHEDQQGRPTEFPSTAPDQPRTAGPSMPEIVLGQSQEALRTYRRQLQEGVTAGQWSQKWADERMTEAFGIAEIAVREAKTRAEELQSTRAAEINLAQGRATMGANAISTALDHVNKLNGRLPEGSSLGGQTFAALLGLQMLMQTRSGIDTIDPRGRREQILGQPGGELAPRGAPAPLTQADLANRASIEARRQEIAAQTAQAAAPSGGPPARDDWRLEPPVAAPTAGEPGGPPLAPGPVWEPAAPAPAQYPVLDALGPSPGAEPPPGDPTRVSTPAADPRGDPGAAVVRNAPVGAPRPEEAVPGIPPPVPLPDASRDFSPIPGIPPPVPIERDLEPIPGIPPPVPLPDFPGPYRSGAPAPSQYGGGMDDVVQRAQPWSALASYGPAMPDALAQRARSTAPWNLDPAEIMEMERAGISPDDIWRVPGSPRRVSRSGLAWDPPGRIR